MMDKTADSGVDIKSDAFAGKHVAFCVCGGIGATEVIKIIREIRRYSAIVTPFFSSSAERFVTELSVEWAANRSVIKVAGAHVEYLENYDVVVVAPATLNTLSKAASGIADNPVTLMIASQLGVKGAVLFVPTMNDRLRQHPVFSEHVARLEKWGAQFYSGPAEEDRLKMPSPQGMVDSLREIL